MASLHAHRRHHAERDDGSVASTGVSPGGIPSHLLGLQRSAGNAAVTQLIVQRARFFPTVGVDALTYAQAASEIGYGELPGVTFAFRRSYVSQSDTTKRSGAQRRELAFGEEYKPSIGSWVLHTHRGPGGGLLTVHTKPESYSDKRAGVDKTKATTYLKDPDSSHKPA